MFKRMGLLVLALAAMLILVSPAPANAQVRFGVAVGPAYSYPAYPYAYSYPYPYAYPYDYYPYATPIVIHTFTRTSGFTAAMGRLGRLLPGRLWVWPRLRISRVRRRTWLRGWTRFRRWWSRVCWRRTRVRWWRTRRTAVSSYLQIIAQISTGSRVGLTCGPVGIFGQVDNEGKLSMSAVAQRLTAQRFREMYAQRKPHFELFDGIAVQKALPTKLHSILQFVLSLMLKEFGFKSRPELTLAIDESWEPTPDVCGIIGPEEDPYPTRAVAVAIEVLSPDDRFTRVIQKCRKYSEWGVEDILVFDPVGREGWLWDAASGDLSSDERELSIS